MKFNIQECIFRLLHDINCFYLFVTDADGLCLNQGCCGPQARSKLTAQAKSQLERSLRTEITKLADILASRAVRFDGQYNVTCTKRTYLLVSSIVIDIMAPENHKLCLLEVWPNITLSYL